MQNNKILIFDVYNEEKFSMLYLVYNMETLIFANFQFLHDAKCGNFDMRYFTVSLTGLENL